MRLGELAARLGGDIAGDTSVEVVRVSPLESSEPGSITFLAHPKHKAKLQTCRASVVIIGDVRLAELAAAAPAAPAILTVKDAYVAYAQAATILHPPVVESSGVHPTAVIHQGARVDPTAHVGAFAVVAEGARVEARAVLHPHVVLYRGAEVGEDSVLHSGVSIREGCRVGRRVILHDNVVIGADGFGFTRDANGRHVKIPQIGIVEIEDDVEIGALSAVDRASMGVTRVKRGTKIDNLVQIGHSVEVGEDGIVCAQVGVAGSTKIGDRVILAGQVGVADHAHLGDDVVVAAQSGLHGDLPPKSRVAGSPAFDAREWLRTSAALKQLPELMKRVRELEARLNIASPPKE